MRNKAPRRFLHHPGLQPFLDQPQYARIGDAMLHELDHPTAYNISQGISTSSTIVSATCRSWRSPLEFHSSPARASRRVEPIAHDLVHFFVGDYLPVTANQNPRGFPGRAGDVTKMIGAIH